jgi:hypothetical protein
MLLAKDDRHPGVDLGDELLGSPVIIAAMQPLVVCPGGTLLHPDRVGELSSDDLFPLVESVRWPESGSDVF